MKTPVDTYLESKEAAARKDHQLQLYYDYKNSGWHPDKLDPILDYFKPVIDQKIRLYKAPDVDEEAMRAQAHMYMAAAVQTFKPEYGFALSTHIEKPLMKLQRYNQQQQNFARISEGRTRKIGPVNQAFQILQTDLGRDPTHDEVASKANELILESGKRMRPFTPKAVEQTLRSQRKDISSSTFESDPTSRAVFRMDELVHLMPDHIRNSNLFKPHERELALSVFYHATGHDGHERLDSNRELAKRLKISEPKASSIKTRILNEAKRLTFGDE